MHTMSPRECWEPVGPSGRFQVTELPLSDEAIRLNGGPRYLFYAEFDTAVEGRAWHDYIFDPLAMLIAENVPLPPELGHLGINILKLEDVEGLEPSDDYVSRVTERGTRTLEVMKAATPVDPGERKRHVSTMVINHEIPLNPRIGTTYA
jgi:hypothetical protein